MDNTFSVDELGAKFGALVASLYARIIVLEKENAALREWRSDNKKGLSAAAAQIAQDAEKIIRRE